MTNWAQQDGKKLFRPTDAAVVTQLSNVSEWVISKKYDPASEKAFLQSGADFFLVAHALAGGYTVVTHEVKSNSVKRIKIPDVCNGLGLHCITPYEMLRTEKAKFVLA